MAQTVPPRRSPPLLLASSSIHRRALLERLRLPFATASPNVDERRRRPDEPADAYAARLAVEKTESLAAIYPAHLIVGADQTAVAPDGALLGKPGGRERTIAQLQAVAGREVQFCTAACLRRPGGARDVHVDRTLVAFRPLTPQEIEAYVDAERPYDCAGGFKVEGLGISLFERIDSVDPTALIGLPLIWLAGALRRAGIALP